MYSQRGKYWQVRSAVIPSLSTAWAKRTTTTYWRRGGLPAQLHGDFERALGAGSCKPVVLHSGSRENSRHPAHLVRHGATTTVTCSDARAFRPRIREGEIGCLFDEIQILVEPTLVMAGAKKGTT